MKAADVMVSSVISVRSDATVQEVADVLLKNRISDVPVMAAGELVGIVSEGVRVASALAVLAGVVVTQVAEAADAYNGGQIARRWCEPCHVVASDQQGTTGEAPPFASIAKRSGFDAGQLAVFLFDPHPKMPNMSLTRIEAGDLAAYIASLGK
jgi:mono/diheme cytochrome c family protein